MTPAWTWRTARLLLILLLLPAKLPVRAAESDRPEPRPAQLKISGYGLLGGLRLKKMLRILQDGKTRPAHLDANYVEDAALLLMSRLGEDGYQEPRITAELTLSDGSQAVYVWDESVEDPLPRPMAATAVHFRIRKGVLFHFEHIEFAGLTAISEKRALSYFIETGGLVSLKRNRIYSPERLRRGVTSVSDELQRMGYHDASVVATNFIADPRTGRIWVRIEVTEGPRYFVQSVQQEVYFGSNAEPSEVFTITPDRPHSRVWEQDFAQSVRTNFYRQGYPDTTVALQTMAQTVRAGTNQFGPPLSRPSATLSPSNGERAGRGAVGDPSSVSHSNRVDVDLRAVVKTGERIRVGDVSFTGNQRTRPQVLERRLPLHEGDWLNRIRAENGRYRLSRLGVFDSVELKYEVVDDHTRNITYELHEGKQIDVSLLLGWGSYELLRGGVQVDQYNVFGRAHHQRLRLIQSFKASSADYAYTMPELFGENMDVFLAASGLRREEVSFTRLEYGGGAGIRKYLRHLRTDISVRYNYEILEAQGASADLEEVGLKNTRAAAIITDINHDRRDNPLYPRRGYKAFANIELASEYLGGDVNYQRLDLSAAWHLPLSDSHWMHLGLSHGFIASIGSRSEDLPFNRRFFPGGENSVRGFQEGEAAPRNEEGRIVGAETYWLGNLEFEQGLTPKWSLVAFADAVGFAQRLEDYPSDTTLVSVGGGLRWKTFIGPVRVEYGYNLNPRPRDPTGTLHVSLGFPF